MSEVVIEKKFKQSPDIVFAFLTQIDNILKWWGPEGVTVPVHNLSFSEKGPWFSEMRGSEGQKYKVSGEVKAVESPSFLELTWAWHDDDDVRGHESNVRFEISPAKDGGTSFKLIHTGFADEESAKNHFGGWMSSIGRLEKFVN